VTDLARVEFRLRNTVLAKTRKVLVMLCFSLVLQGIEGIRRWLFRALVAAVTT